MSKKNYVIVCECGRYALIDRGHEYVVVTDLNKETMSWGHGAYFSPYPVTEVNKLNMLTAAADYMCRKATDSTKPGRMRMQEIAEKAMSFIGEQCAVDDDACDFIEELGLSYEEKEYFHV